jgi:hypothetical protein
MRAALVLLAALAGCAFQPTGGEPADGTAADALLDDAAADDAAGDAADAASADAARADGATTRCPAGYEVRATGTYRHVAEVATWNAARADCADDDDGGGFELRTHLVVLADDLERVAVRAAYPGPKLWLGLSDRVTTSTWRWVTLEPIPAYPPASGPPWKGGQPNNGGSGAEDCVYMESGGDWDDRRCDNDTEAYVCECDAYDEVASQSDPQS